MVRVVVLCLLGIPLAFGQMAVQGDFFESRIRPILAERCDACHAKSAMGGLRTDSRENLLKGGNSGPAIVPGQAEKSLLILAVSGRHERFKMPMSGTPLNEREVADLGSWIKHG